MNQAFIVYYDSCDFIDIPLSKDLYDEQFITIMDSDEVPIAIEQVFTSHMYCPCEVPWV